jgi:acetolactate synthase-1/2/3 large subunit
MFVAGGRAPQGRWGQGSLQEIDHIPLVASITKYAATALTADDVGCRFDEALRAARTPHRGPTFVDVPLDGWGPTDSPVPTAPSAAELAGPAMDANDMTRVADLVNRAVRPVVMIGGDVYWAGAEDVAREFVEVVNVPAFANDMGRGVLPADHELSFARARSLAFREADLIVVAGTPLDFRLSFGRFPDAEVVHLADTQTELRAAFAFLAERVQPSRDAGDWVERLRGEEHRARAADEARLQSDATPIDPVRVYGELRRRLDRDATVVGDGGDFVSYAGRYVDTYTPGGFLGPGPYGCLGSGTGYALAAALARPDRQTVVLYGDGALGFSLGDLDSLARHRANVVGIVGNNGVWGLEKHPMQRLFGYDVACDLAPGTRYDLVAADLGCHGEFVTEPAQLGPALDRAFAYDGPALVNVLTDPADEYPRSSNLG